jgi:hypothetical protein
MASITVQMTWSSTIVSHTTRLSSRLRGASRAAVQEAAEEVVAEAHWLTYQRWQYHTGMAGMAWEVKQDSWRTALPGNEVSVQVGAGGEGRAAGGYVVPLNQGWTTRSGNRIAGGNMLQQALAKAGKERVLPISIKRNMSTGMAP